MEKWKKTFWTIWTGQSLSIITSSIVQFAIIWYITDVTRSAFYLSMASLIGLLPQGLLGIFSGSIIDKYDRKKIMIISDIVIAMAGLIIFIYSMFSGVVPIWLLFVVLGVRSVGSAFHNPSLQALMPLIVPEKELLKYSGYNQVGVSISLILAPALAAFLYASMKLGNIILIDVFGALFAIITLMIVTIPKVTPQEEKTSYITDIKEGIKIILKSNSIKSIFIMSVIFMIVFMPISSLFPLMSMDYFNGNSIHAGIVEIIFAIGMLIGSLILSSKKYFQNKRKNITLSIMIIGITLFLSGILSSTMFIIFCILCFFMGKAGALINASISTIFAEIVDPNYLGRVYANYISLSVLAMPIGLIISGLFADIVGINIWFAISGLLIILLGIFQTKLKFDN
jgi:DHA3 family macrolide efflux protein-like MFS transporter